MKYPQPLHHLLFCLPRHSGISINYEHLKTAFPFINNWVTSHEGRLAKTQKGLMWKNFGGNYFHPEPCFAKSKDAEALLFSCLCSASAVVLWELRKIGLQFIFECDFKKIAIFVWSIFQYRICQKKGFLCKSV